MEQALDTTYYANNTDADTRYKVQVWHDYDAPYPLGDFDGMEPLAVIAAVWLDHEDLDGFTLASIIGEVLDRQGYRDIERAATIINRLARLAGKPERIYVFNHRGYVQSDWATVIVESTEGEDYASNTFDIWSMWAKGDVYGVTVDTEEQGECGYWHETDTDSLWGIYADDVEDAREYFLNNYAPHDLDQTNTIESE